jgi:SAM-dependent methyltransferase
LTKHITTEGELIFRERQDGTLELVGDFDGLYRSQEDPWAQSGNNIEWQQYYQFSRGRIIAAIKAITPIENVLEIGCGIGFAVDVFSKNLPGITLDGLDISSVAIARANELFSEYHFTIADIASEHLNIQKKYDAVILNQVLWYILKDLKKSISNAHQLLNAGGHLLISQSFLKNEQRYGRDIINGCDGLLNFMATRYAKLFSLEGVQYDKSREYIHNDGLLVYKKLEA